MLSGIGNWDDDGVDEDKEVEGGLFNLVDQIYLLHDVPSKQERSKKQEMWLIKYFAKY